MSEYSELRKLPVLQFATRPVPAPSAGAQGRLVWLSLDDLFIDADYQRDILDTGKGNIRRMIEGFSWALFGVLVVGERSDLGHASPRYAIIDGQHRATAAKSHGGIKKVPCLVLAGGVEDEARAFAAINGNVTRIHALQSFRAAVAAKQPEAVAIVTLCRRAGVTIAPYPKMEMQPGETMALGAIRKAIKQHGEPMTLRALKLLRAASPEHGLGASVISGAIALFAKEPELAADPEKQGAYLRTKGGFIALLARADKRRAGYGGTMVLNFAAVLRAALFDAQRNAGAPMQRMMAGR